MEIFNIMEILLSFVILPLVVLIATLISCGNSRPIHQVKMTSNSGQGSMKMGQYEKFGNYKTGNQIGSKRSMKTEKTRSTRSRSIDSTSKSRRQRSLPLKQSQRAKPLTSSGISAEISSKRSKKLEDEQRDLKMEPIELHWNTTGGVQKVFISNPTNIRRAIKVKCSDSKLYRVNPVYSFIEPGQVLAIDILRQNGGAKVDKMVFLAATAKKEDQNPRTIFQDSLPKPMMVLPLIATSNNA
uniref:Major sperm protein n=1 Tax=Wuchereria bancrofti TaxID=6293 RepID=A0AAF5PSW4_WUCBA